MIRLDKFLSQAGVASRRQLREIIRSGAVCIDGARVTDEWWRAKSRCNRNCESCGLCRKVLADALVDCEVLDGNCPLMKT